MPCYIRSELIKFSNYICPTHYKYTPFQNMLQYIDQLLHANT